MAERSKWTYEENTDAWFLRLNPFLIYIFEMPDRADVVWHYGSATNTFQFEDAETAKAEVLKMALAEVEKLVGDLEQMVEEVNNGQNNN